MSVSEDDLVSFSIDADTVFQVYKFTVLEIWRDFNVLSYRACPRYPYIRVYQLYDMLMILCCFAEKEANELQVASIAGRVARMV